MQSYKANGDKLLYREVQKFNLWLRLWLIVSDITVLLILLFIYLTKCPKMPLVVWVVIPTMFILGPLLFWLMKLETEVRSDGLYVRFYPIHIRFKKFVSADLAEYFARQYHPILEYGGWGIRHGFGKKGKAYNMSGSRGVQLVFKNGQRLLIGSQNPDKLVDAITLMAQNNQRRIK